MECIVLLPDVEQPLVTSLLLERILEYTDILKYAPLSQRRDPAFWFEQRVRTLVVL